MGAVSGRRFGLSLLGRRLAQPYRALEPVPRLHSQEAGRYKVELIGQVFSGIAGPRFSLPESRAAEWNILKGLLYLMV